MRTCECVLGFRGLSKYVGAFVPSPMVAYIRAKSSLAITTREKTLSSSLLSLMTFSRTIEVTSNSRTFSIILIIAARLLGCSLHKTCDSSYVDIFVQSI